MNGWRSLRSYTWTLENNILNLTKNDDPCSQGLRTANLIDQLWYSCRPTNVEAMITDHWQKPVGCDLTD